LILLHSKLVYFLPVYQCFSSGENHGKRQEKESENRKQLQASTNPIQEKRKETIGGRNLPICAMCGEEVEHVTRCKTCAERFCSDCGEPEQKLCIYCLEADEDDDWNDDEDEGWNDDW
jgi:hypothetical protein